MFFIRILKNFVHPAVMFLAMFTAFGLTAGIINPRMDATYLWLSIDSAPLSIGWFLLIIFSFGVLFFRRLPERLRNGVRGGVLGIGVIALSDSRVYYRLIAEDSISSRFPLPLSLPIALCMIIWFALPPNKEKRKTSLFTRAFTVSAVVAAGVIFLFAQIMTFGSTDYRRPADAIVVLGAAVTPHGRPSLPLYDRTVTGCELWREGLAPVIVFSGGRNPLRPISEPEAMRRVANAMDVPDDAIILDEHGVNTAATVENVIALAEEHNWKRILVVSNNYHLSRTSIAFQRAGIEAATVPARETRFMSRTPFYIQRELFAWVYYFLTKHTAAT